MKKFEVKMIYRIIMLMAILLVTGCAKDSKEFSQEFFAMDTYMSLSATGENGEEVIRESKEYVEQLEAAISRTNEASEIYKLNHSDGEVVTVSDATYEIVSIAVECAEKTDGKFDPTVCAITDLWGIGTENARIPSESEIAKALQTVSYKNVLLLEDNGIQLLNGAQIDLGGIGKGYAADAIREIYTKYEIEKGIIALGGNVYMVGEKDKNTPWNVGIMDPDVDGEYSIGVQVVDKSVVTTGAYERYFEEDGVIYHHIFDTKTGYPTKKDVKSVTVVSENSTRADVYATALFAMGYDAAISFVENYEELEVILIRNDNQIYASTGLEGCMTLDEKYTLANIQQE